MDLDSLYSGLGEISNRIIARQTMLKALRKTCNELDLLLILDEIANGFGGG